NMANFTAHLALWNHTGQPAISVPADPAADGFPVGVQLVAPPDGEPLLLALATDVAHEAGAGLREAFSRLGDGGLAIHAKSTPTDLVSEADVATERRIRARLEAARPD